MKPHQREFIANLLVEASLSGLPLVQADQEIAKKYQKSQRSIRRYRQMAVEDEELAALVRAKLSDAKQGWADELSGPIRAGLIWLKDATSKATVSAEMIHAVAGYVKVLAEIDFATKLLDARLSRTPHQPHAEARQVAAPRVVLLTEGEPVSSSDDNVPEALGTAEGSLESPRRNDP